MNASQGTESLINEKPKDLEASKHSLSDAIVTLLKYKNAILLKNILDASFQIIIIISLTIGIYYWGLREWTKLGKKSLFQCFVWRKECRYC